MSAFDRREAATVLIGAAAMLVLPAVAAGKQAALSGDFEQGGMVSGRTQPGARVSIAGRRLRVSSDGLFVFGFGRDHGKSARLSITYADGSVQKQTLEIKQRDYKVQRIDGLPQDQVSPPQSVLDRIASDNRKIGAARRHDTAETWFAEGISWPVQGRITGVYGSQRILNGMPRRPHFGVDIAQPAGTPVMPGAPGIVRLAEEDLYYTGGTVIIDHGHAITTTYLHMSRLDVKVGDSVARDTVIGAVGATGRATGPHMCWRLNWFQERLDPQLAAPPMRG
jgi:hypothetical protein